MTELADPIRGAIHDVARALMPRLEELGAEGAREIARRVPDIMHTGVYDIVVTTCQANTAIMFDALARGVPMESAAPTAEVLQLTRKLAQRGLPLTAVMRGYQIGTQFAAEQWADAVVAHAPAGSDPVALVKVGMSYILGAVDVITTTLTTEYVGEAERMARERSLARVEAVGRVLRDRSIDIDSASAQLGYRLNGKHVAVVLRDRTDSSEIRASLDVALRELTQAFGTGKGLAVRVDMRTTWCWLPAPTRGPAPVSLPASCVLVGIGRPGSGLDGFRRSHREACDALRVAELAGTASASVTYFDDVDIAAVCSAEPERCREFVRSELGRLAATDKSAALQRATLSAFYAANSNYRATGVDLGIHHNTVRYRLEQIERILGRDLGERRLALELALHLYDVLGPLTQPDRVPGTGPTSNGLAERRAAKR